MLDTARQSKTVNRLDPTQLHVILPPELEQFFIEKGYMPTTAFEDRRNARLRLRCTGELRFFDPPPALGLDHPLRNNREGRVLIKDLSRHGIGLLYHEQILPEERFEVRLPGLTVKAVAVRCRKLGPQCYDTGGTVLSCQRFVAQT